MLDEILKDIIRELIDERIEKLRKALTPDSLLTIPKAAKELGISKDTIYEWVKKGRLASYKQPGKKGKRVFRNELFDFIRKNYSDKPKKKVKKLVEV